jgi:glycosyltransferase involved in cell wall biosynthesis
MSASTPLVSIIMPAHYSEGFIGRSIESVLTQTHSNWELLIIADDGVDYAPILKRENLQDSRIRLLSTNDIGTGPSNARNVGLHHSRGDMVALLDSDDLFHPQKLERCIPVVAEHGLAVTAYQEIAFEADGTHRLLRTNKDSGGSRLISDEQGALFFFLCIGNSFSMFRRDKITHQWDLNIPVMEDLLFLLTAYNQLSDFYFVDEVLHYYVRRDGSLTHESNTIHNFLRAKKALIDIVSQEKVPLKPVVAKELQRCLELSLQAEQEYSDIFGNSGYVQDSDMIFNDILIRTFKMAGVPILPFAVPHFIH